MTKLFSIVNLLYSSQRSSCILFDNISLMIEVCRNDVQIVTALFESCQQ